MKFKKQCNRFPFGENKSVILISFVLYFILGCAHKTKTHTTSIETPVFSDSSTTQKEKYRNSYIPLEQRDFKPTNEIQYIKNSILNYYWKKNLHERSLGNDYRLFFDSNFDDKSYEFATGIAIVEMQFPDSAYTGFHRVIPPAKSFVRGDLNDDGQDDYVVSVLASGSGSISWRETFVFFSNNSSNKLSPPIKLESPDFPLHTNNGIRKGQFFPKRIMNGLLQGTFELYVPGDPRCCPSQEMPVYYQFLDGRPELVTKL